MSSVESVEDRFNQSIQTFKSHLTTLTQLQQRSHHELLQSFNHSNSVQLSNQAIQLLSHFLDDKLNLYRFLKREKFDIENTLKLLSNTLQWRLDSQIDLLSSSSIDPFYHHQPLFYFHPQLKDKWSRPCGVLNLKHVSRTEDGTLDGLKEFIAWSWELGRRYMQDSNSDSLNTILSQPENLNSNADPKTVPIQLQMVIIVDLKDASLNNLELELIPYFMDLLKNNFPGMVGAIFVLNYGWMYSGMWQVAKRVLPQSALDRIMFPSEKELLKFFNPSNLSTQHGGSFEYQYHHLNNPIINSYGKAPSVANTISALPTTLPTEDPAELNDQSLKMIHHISELSPSLSRISSLESLRDLFFSAPTTPWQTSYPSTPARGHRPNWLSMTTVHTGHHTPVSSHQRHHSLSVSKFGEAIRENLLRKAQREEWNDAPLLRSTNPLRDFRLYLPSKKLTTEEEELTPSNSDCSATVVPDDDDDREADDQSPPMQISISMPETSTPWTHSAKSNLKNCKPNAQWLIKIGSTSSIVDRTISPSDLLSIHSQINEESIPKTIINRKRKRDLVKLKVYEFFKFQRNLKWILNLIFQNQQPFFNFKWILLILLISFKNKEHLKSQFNRLMFRINRINQKMIS
ncbi:hypothetical protein DFH28DRAFT_1096918 [Melampsora americana]|nr:hypothetical protein DFH28DRAFT_1096918 [Melampsora americana]